MTVDRAVNIWAGILIFVGVALGHYYPDLANSPMNIRLGTWIVMFVAFMLIQSSFTGFCPSAMIFKAMGMKSSGASS